MSVVFLVFHLQLLCFDKKEALTKQIILLPLFIWFGKEVALRKYIAEEILDLRVNKQKQNLFPKNKENLMHWIKFMGRDEQNAKPNL